MSGPYLGHDAGSSTRSGALRFSLRVSFSAVQREVGAQPSPSEDA